MLLQTKFFIPPNRKDHIARQELVSLLDACIDHKLSLVIAPAGYGKSCLMAQWAQQYSQQNPIACGWLALDEDDNDPRNFWRYVIGALQRLEKGLGTEALEQLNLEADSSLKAAISSLLNDLANLQHDAPLILVLDDFHHVQDPAVVNSLDFFLDYLPASLRVVLMTRKLPELALSKFRACGDLLELPAERVSFTQEETSRFIQENHGLELSENSLSTLQQRTEGWPVGLHLAALSLKNKSAGGEQEAFIDNYSGEDRHIADYLINEVFDQQVEEVQSFLLAVSLLPRFNAELCDYLLEGSDSNRMLQIIEASNLFLIPLDDQRQWYRFHDLFRESLKVRLDQSFPDLVPVYQIRAAQWFEDNNCQQEALDQIVQLGDWNRAVLLIESIGFDLIKARQYVTLKNWLLKLPELMVEKRPKLLLFNLRVWTLSTVLHLNPTENYVTLCQELLSDAKELISANDLETCASRFGVDSLHQISELQAELDLVRSYWARLRGDVTTSAQLSEAVLEQAREMNLPLKSPSYMSIGMSQYLRGDIKSGSEAVATALHYALEEKNFDLIESASVRLAWVHQWQGDFKSAYQVYLESRSFLDSHQRLTQSFICWQNLALSAMYREFNEMDKANECFDTVLHHIDCDSRFSLFAPITQSRLLESERDFKGAITAVERAEQLYFPIADSVQGFPSLSAARTKIAILDNDLATTRQWVQQVGLDIQFNTKYRHEEERITLARAWLVLDKIDQELITLLLDIIEYATAGNHVSNIVVSRILLAMAYYHLKEEEACLDQLRLGLAMAARCGYVRSVIDEQPYLAEILKLAIRNKIEPDYAEQLLRLVDSSADASANPMDALIEPLSQRELDVLLLLGKGLQNKQIAEQLFIGIGTVKTHMRNILGKLAVSNRTQAVTKAREFGLLVEE